MRVRVRVRVRVSVRVRVRVSVRVRVRVGMKYGSLAAQFIDTELTVEVSITPVYQLTLINPRAIY